MLALRSVVEDDKEVQRTQEHVESTLCSDAQWRRMSLPLTRTEEVHAEKA